MTIYSPMSELLSLAWARSGSVVPGRGRPVPDRSGRPAQVPSCPNSLVYPRPAALIAPKPIPWTPRPTVEMMPELSRSPCLLLQTRWR
jgi:hypothetical protein